jgi:hypothetical protein
VLPSHLPGLPFENIMFVISICHLFSPYPFIS